METINGFCKCGCGGKTNLSVQNHTQHGWIKGEPLQYIRGHSQTGKRGILARNWRGGVSSTNGYVEIFKPDHPRKSSRGYVKQSYLVAEMALGNPLPRGAVVHHVNSIRSDDRKLNLVVCENNGYHMTLHANRKAFDACGHKNWRRCCVCKEYDDLKNLIRTTHRTIFHQKCRNEIARQRYWAQKAARLSNAA